MVMVVVMDLGQKQSTHIGQYPSTSCGGVQDFSFRVVVDQSVSSAIEAGFLYVSTVIAAINSAEKS